MADGGGERGPGITALPEPWPCVRDTCASLLARQLQVRVVFLCDLDSSPTSCPV